MGKKGLFIFMALSSVTLMSGCLVVPNQQTGSYEQPYAEEEYVAPVIVYEEPVYLPPPVRVNYRYDYYTYENRGGYVNIVFFQNGRRYRSEPWQVDGRRMTPMHLDNWRQSHKVERVKLERHRQMLEQQHHIRHADTYYGVKPVQPRPVQARPYQARPDQPRQNQPRPDQIRPNQPRPDQIRPGQPRPDQARPYQARPDQNRPGMNQNIEKPRPNPSYRQPAPQAQQQRPAQPKPGSDRPQGSRRPSGPDPKTDQPHH